MAPTYFRTSLPQSGVSSSQPMSFLILMILLKWHVCHSSVQRSTLAPWRYLGQIQISLPGSQGIYHGSASVLLFLVLKTHPPLTKEVKKLCRLLATRAGRPEPKAKNSARGSWMTEMCRLCVWDIRKHMWQVSRIVDFEPVPQSPVPSGSSFALSLC